MTTNPIVLAEQEQPKRRTRLRAWRISQILDRATLDAGLGNILQTYSGHEDKIRTEALALYSTYLRQAKDKAGARLEAGADGLDTARLLAAIHDQIIQSLFDFTTQYIYPLHNPTLAEQLSVAAIGGYGRGAMAPFSDVDLLFLRHYKRTAWADSVIEYMLYMLWDMGLKMGHAFRTIEECIKISQTDLTACTALLDARYMAGDQALFDDFIIQYDAKVKNQKRSDFVGGKLAERDKRLSAQNNSRYVVEPNIKNGKGGLRDLHTLFWIVKWLYGGHSIGEVLKAPVFTPTEARSFMRAARFLWGVRCHLHFLTNRAEERLSFDVQTELAQRFGYYDTGKRLGVERFMKRYFLVSKEIGALTRILCTKLEADRQKQVSGLSRFFPPTPPKPLAEKGFVNDGGRITLADSELIKKEPLQALRLFRLADQHQMDIHPMAMQAVTRSLAYIKPALRKDQAARACFLEIATSGNAPARIMKLMNEAGLLGRFLPEFGHIVAQTQFNMYHHYTIDEHTLNAVNVINNIENGREEEAHPLATKLFPLLENRRALYLAMLLHDCGKGHGDQQVEGAKVARDATRRLGLDKDECELVAWLVGHHLELSDAAQKRDISDPRTISEVAKMVGSIERLRLLLILTVADIRAVGPDVWNGWKGHLLRELYFGVEASLRGGRTDEADIKAQLAERAEAARSKIREVLGQIPDAFEDLEDAYWVSFEKDNLLWHCQTISALEQSPKAYPDKIPLIALRQGDDADTIEVLILTPDRSALLSDLVGSISLQGGDIITANAYTLANAMALDVMVIQMGESGAEISKSRLKEIKIALEQAASGKKQDFKLMTTSPSSRQSAFLVNPTVQICPAIRSGEYMIDITAANQPGLLFRLIKTLHNAGATINSAHIGSYGERVFDNFYIQFADQIYDSAREEALKAALLSILSEGLERSEMRPAKSRHYARSKAADSF